MLFCLFPLERIRTDEVPRSQGVLAGRGKRALVRPQALALPRS